MSVMTITQAVKRKKFYRGKELWEIYHSWGRAATQSRLRDWAKSQGMYDSELGEPSQMGPFFSMWKYALKYPEAAWPHYEKWAKEYESELIAKGVEINFENFIRDIYEHAKSGGVVGEKTFEEFCEKYKEYGLDPNAYKRR